MLHDVFPFRFEKLRRTHAVSIAQNFQKVDEIDLLLRVELEIADLTIGLIRRSGLGGRDRVKPRVEWHEVKAS